MAAQLTMKERLEQLECHFTWELSDNLRRLQQQQDFLEVTSESECSWKGHLYNVLAYIYYKIDSSTESAEKALACLHKAEVILKEQERDGRGPGLMVNQANLAWLHFHLNELAEAQRYLEEVERLQEEFPAPPGCELHPEVHGEKGWTQMKFGADFRTRALSNFEKASKGDPDKIAWHKGLVLAKEKLNVHRGDGGEITDLFLQQVEAAKSMDPDDTRISIIYLHAVVETGGKEVNEAVREAHTLVRRLQPPLEDLGPILQFLRSHDSLDSALRVAAEIEGQYPTDRDAKKQLANCYKWKVFESEKDMIDRELMEKAISVHESVSNLYPLYLRGKIDLGDIYELSGNTDRADQIYSSLLQEIEGLEPRELQLLYNRYAARLHFRRHSSNESIDYRKKVVAIPQQSLERKKSITILMAIASNENHHRHEEIQTFLNTFNPAQLPM